MGIMGLEYLPYIKNISAATLTHIYLPMVGKYFIDLLFIVKKYFVGLIFVSGYH